MLITDDDKKMAQSMAIARYLAKTLPSKTGDSLYPAEKDPELSYSIDSVVDSVEDFI